MDPTETYELAPVPSTERKSPLMNGIVLVEHIPCENCKYDLFHSQLGGQCPECGHAMQWSINQYRRMQARRAEAKPIGRSVIAMALFVAVAVIGLHLVHLVWPKDTEYAVLGVAVFGIKVLVAWVQHIFEQRKRW